MKTPCVAMALSIHCGPAKKAGAVEDVIAIETQDKVDHNVTDWLKLTKMTTSSPTEKLFREKGWTS